MVEAHIPICFTARKVLAEEFFGMLCYLIHRSKPRDEENRYLQVPS